MASNIGKKKVNPMFARLFTAGAEKKNGYRIYQGLVAQARSTAFYADMEVPDTVEGRFDMILLHVFLADERLEAAGDSYIRLRRYIQEAMVSDMDRSFRELGVGDMSVGKEMKKVGAALLGRKAAYKDALAKTTDTSALEEAITKNIYKGEDRKGLGNLITYIIEARKTLAATELDSPAKCELGFTAA